MGSCKSKSPQILIDIGERLKNVDKNDLQAVEKVCVSSWELYELLSRPQKDELKDLTKVYMKS